MIQPPSKKLLTSTIIPTNDAKALTYFSQIRGTLANMKRKSNRGSLDALDRDLYLLFKEFETLNPEVNKSIQHNDLPNLISD